MRIQPLHPWEVTPAEDIRLQEHLRERVVTGENLDEIRVVAGVNVSIREGLARAAIVALSFPDLTVSEVVRAEAVATFPYVPGLLAFREAPVILAACQKLATDPDLFIFDAHGLAHPRRFGLACHVGLILDKPAIGCARSPLCGEHGELPPTAGAWVPLYERDEVIGAAVRTRGQVKPVYVSVGHRMTLETAIRYILATCRGYRQPEPCRFAHQAAGQPE